MQQNKKIFFIILFFFGIIIHAQPSFKISKINFNFSFSNKSHSKIYFKQKNDSTFSKNKYLLRIQYGYYECNYGNQQKEFNKQGYFQLNKKNINDELLFFREGNFILNLIRYNLKEYISIIEIEFKKKKMHIYVKFDKFVDNSYNICNFNIIFQEGVFEIRDAENPQLIKIKEKDL